MGEDIYVRNVKPEIKSKLKKLAKEKGLSLNAFINTIIEDYATSPEIRNINNKYTELVNTVISIYQSDNAEMKEIIAENSYILKQIVEKLK